MNRILSRFGVVAIGIAALDAAILAPAPCLAQFSGSGPTTMGAASSRMMRGAPPVKGEAAAPPVIPGTKIAPEAAISTQSPGDMSPNDALFDAVNRGDLAAARDAVNRGANLDAHNVLGLTPMDLSVDLGRNDISFMLLSMRGEDSTLAKDAGARDAGAREGRRPARVASGFTRRARVAAAMPAPAPQSSAVAVPRLYSGNGGTPIPGAGFLGFGEGRSIR
jgi:hypothetical protein